MIFLLIVAVATVASMGLFASKDVVVKLLPFDNKSELQVVVDLPEGSSMEATERTLMAAADRLVTIPELSNIQLYAGTSAPFGFNGLGAASGTPDGSSGFLKVSPVIVNTFVLLTSLVVRVTLLVNLPIRLVS